ncbi:MAG: ATP-binding cassette domain-containing protein [Gammaproteobacteria bacterium]|nr:ATP-binding cassette domain-containing protein [Gammaproteobacteria bacterium]
MSEHLRITDLCVDLAGYPVVNNINLSLKTGQIGSLLGPSGCGKTTLLRTIAGFEKPREGSIYIRDQLISDQSQAIPPEHRKIGMVFQDLALFPHLTVEGNVEFGIRHLSASKRIARVKSLLELIGLGGYLKSYPHELSGGQQQRVALVRAMAPRPDLLLLDEPFSGQDTERREQLSLEVRNILVQDGVTALLVTHDQHEAFTFADAIGVLNHGRLRQWDSAFNLYHKPADRFVADFIGQGVFITGKVLNDRELETPLGLIRGEMDHVPTIGTEVDLLVRPDDVLHDDFSPVKAIIETKSFRGADHLYNLTFPGGADVLCLAPSHHNHKVGEKIGVKLDMDHLVFFPKVGE